MVAGRERRRSSRHLLDARGMRSVSGPVETVNRIACSELVCACSHSSPQPYAAQRFEALSADAKQLVRLEAQAPLRVGEAIRQRRLGVGASARLLTRVHGLEEESV